jgi:AAA+ ATPase superfamily predicted ATPase
LLSDYKAYAMKDILALVFNNNSPFLDEGKIILIEKFGKEYGTYFSILSLLANGKTSRNEIETSLGKNVGGYLEKLEDRYGIIRRHRPINAKPNGKLMKYEIVDNFLLFWFRFVYGNQSAIELENFNCLITTVSNQLPAYSGIVLERLIQQELKEKHMYSVIGNYWERGNQNEIDIVAINEQQWQVLIGEVKINKKKGSLVKLQEKASKLLANYPKYEVEYRLFSLEDILKV